jgi:hypothetical protein
VDVIKPPTAIFPNENHSGTLPSVRAHSNFEHQSLVLTTIVSEAKRASSQGGIALAPHQRLPDSEIVPVDVALKCRRSLIIGVIEISSMNIGEESGNQQSRHQENGQNAHARWSKQHRQSYVPLTGPHEPIT